MHSSQARVSDSAQVSNAYLPLLVVYVVGCQLVGKKLISIGCAREQGFMAADQATVAGERNITFYEIGILQTVRTTIQLHTTATLTPSIPG